MTDEKKKQLFPIFAYLYSKKLSPEKYGNTSKGTGIDEADFKAWTEVIQQNPEDMEAITKAATELSDEDWSSLETQVSNKTPLAKNGAKLNKLKKLQSVKKGKDPKKCGCGCNMIDYKEAGGKMSSKCACKCGGTKKEEGGSLPMTKKRQDVIENAPDKLSNLYKKMKNQKIK